MSTMSIIPGFYTISEAAEVIGRSPSQVTRYCQQNLIKALNTGRQWLIEQEEAHKFTPPPKGNPDFRRQKRGRK